MSVSAWWLWLPPTRMKPRGEKDRSSVSLVLSKNEAALGFRRLRFFVGFPVKSARIALSTSKATSWPVPVDSTPKRSWSPERIAKVSPRTAPTPLAADTAEPPIKQSELPLERKAAKPGRSWVACPPMMERAMA